VLDGLQKLLADLWIERELGPREDVDDMIFSQLVYLFYLMFYLTSARQLMYDNDVIVL